MNTREFTEKARSALRLAHEAAAKLGHGYVGSEHVLLGLLREPEGVAARVLRAGGVTEEALLKQLTDTVGCGEPGLPLLQGLTPRGRRIVDIAAAEAARLGQAAIGTEHLLLGILQDGEGMAVQLLAGLGIDNRKLYAGVTDDVLLRPMPPVPRLPGRVKAPRADAEEFTTLAPLKNTGLPKTLARFGRDLTAAAHRLDPVVGRGGEITRVMQILSRRQKNNPVLLGEPGVGKTAVVEGLALRIATGDVPETLADKRLVTLDLSSMVAGTKYRGEFEERFKQIMEETAQARSVILFIDEMHTLVGAGAAEGAIDAANILKPALARGELQMIGATTLEEYRRHVEKDAALERRFQPVTVGEPSEEEARHILLGLRDRYEEHHRVRISDEAVQAAVELSARYIADRFLPDKALDLIDEACARRRMEETQIPEEIRRAEEEVRRLAGEKESALSAGDMETASARRAEECEARAALEARTEERREARQAAEIGPDDVAAVVSAWTGIPVARLTEGEARRLLEMETLLRRRVVGQEEAVAAVARAVRRGRMGLKDPARPVGSFLFLGPSGVGKTELCRALAEAQFGRGDALIRVDMSELMERHSGAKLIGAPPGYAGYQEGGGLTEKVRRRPHAVVLFDEIEKAHPDVLSLLLQVLEDGRLTDGAGRRVDFRSTIIVMTANLGAKALSGRTAPGFAAPDAGGKESAGVSAALDELRRVLPPEFLSRVDDVVAFRPLSGEEAGQIVRLMLRPVRERLAARGVALEVTEEAIDSLAARGRSPEHGVRPLRGLIQSEIEDALSEKLLEGTVTDKAVLSAGEDGKLRVG